MMSHNEIEAWVLKWTFTSVFLGVGLIFAWKILTLMGLYVSSGKAIKDLGGFVWGVFTQAPNIHNWIK